MICSNGAESMAGNGTRIDAINEHGVDMIAIFWFNRHGQVLSIFHISSTGRRNATSLACHRSDRIVIMCKINCNSMVVVHIAKCPATLHCHRCTVHCKGRDIITLLRRNSITLTSATQYLCYPHKCDATALAGIGRDGIAVANEGRRQGMVGSDVAEGVFSDSATIHAVHKHRVGVVALVRRDGHRQALAVSHGGGTGRSDAAARSSGRGDGVTVLRKGSRKSVVGLYAGERPATLCRLLFAVNSQIVNIPALIGRNGAVPTVAAQHLAGTGRRDATALASRNHNTILLLQECGIDHIIQ